eukprot:3385885-Rhodomonas_salina.4
MRSSIRSDSTAHWIAAYAQEHKLCQCQYRILHRQRIAQYARTASSTDIEYDATRIPSYRHSLREVLS